MPMNAVTKPDVRPIKARLAYLGITQEKLALAMGLERSAITRYLREVRPWPKGMEQRIHATLDRFGHRRCPRH